MTAEDASDSYPAEGQLLGVVERPRRRSLPQQVADQLLDLIASSGLPAPELPTERLLAEQLGVSRNVLREALAGLDRVEVLERRGKKRIGNTARARAQLLARLPVDSTGRDLMLGPIEARRMLEPEVAAAAAKSASAEAIEEIERWLSLMEEGTRREERVVDYDSAFHIAIARATGNHTLVSLVAALTDASRDSREASFRPRAATKSFVNDHRKILNAIRRRDSARARAAMAAHMDNVRDLVVASLPAAEDGDPVPRA